MIDGGGTSREFFLTHVPQFIGMYARAGKLSQACFVRLCSRVTSASLSREAPDRGLQNSRLSLRVVVGA
jgi:hypothetical protein